MVTRFPEQAELLITTQRGVIARWQLAGVGVSSDQVLRAQGRDWQVLTSRTWLTHRGDPTPGQLRIAGALEAGPDAALSGCSALIEAGWSGDSDGHVDVVVARGHRSRRIPLPPWLRVHSTVDVPRMGGTPPRVPPARATLDACTWARTPRERMFILTSAVQQQLVSPRAALRELESRSRRPHSRAISEILDEINMGVTTVGEADFLRECRARGLPAPRMQVRRTAGGSRRRIDAEFRTPSGRLVIVEIDGVGHMNVVQWLADLTRHNDLTASTGALCLRVTNWQIINDPDPFFDVLCRIVLEDADPSG